MADRQKNAEEFISILKQTFATKTREEWMSSFREAGALLFGPANTVTDLVSDPQVVANQYIVDFDHPVWGPTKFSGYPVEFIETPGTIRTPAPELGEHTEQVLTDLLGYTRNDIATLKDQGVI